MSAETERYLGLLHQALMAHITVSVFCFTARLMCVGVHVFKVKLFCKTPCGRQSVNILPKVMAAV